MSQGDRPSVPDDLQTFGHPVISEKDIEAVVRQIHTQISIYDDGGIYSQLEARLGQWLGSKHVLTTNSGTTALFSMFFAAGVAPGDEVVVPAYTFFATCTPLFLLGAIPVLADCGPNGNVTAETVQSVLSERTRAIVVTHMWGIPCEMDALKKLATKYQIPLLEDASHAHGATYHGRLAGVWGDAGAWSLQGKKLLTAGEGGLFATDNLEMFERAILLGHYNKRAKKNVSNPALLPYVTTGLGSNLRMHPFAAAFAAAQFDNLDDQLRDRREVAAYLSDHLRTIDGLSLPTIPPNAEPSWYAFPVLYDQTEFDGLTKDDFVSAVHSEGAVEVDIPRSTCVLSSFPLFRHPESILPIYSKLGLHVPT
ncbi:MAG TPA: aminotransferase class I/II-fold pyridoxal phosphate-dependent enzyme, partial [Longimicrobium sp.]